MVVSIFLQLIKMCSLGSPVSVPGFGISDVLSKLKCQTFDKLLC